MNTTTHSNGTSNLLPPGTWLDCLSRIPVTLSLALAAIAVAAMPAAGELLQFDRLAIGSGEFWRLATCHLAHWNLEHLKWDLLMFVVLGAVCEWRDPLRMRCCVAAAAGAVSLLVAQQFPEIAFYRGLSGIDTALFTLLAIDLLRDAVRDRNWLLVTATGGMLYGFAVKTLFEAATGRTIFVDQQAAGFLAIVWDHVVAGIVGLLCAAAFGLRDWLAAVALAVQYPTDPAPACGSFQQTLSRYKRRLRWEYLRRVLT